MVRKLVRHHYRIREGLSEHHHITPAVEIESLVRPALTRLDEPAAETPRGQARPTEERFWLRVDGQMKRSFSSKEPAMTAGRAIKKAFPVVVVTLEDTKDGGIETIK